MAITSTRAAGSNAQVSSQKGGQAEANAANGKQPKVIPFVRGSREFDAQDFDVKGTLGAGPLQLGPINIQSNGFLRYIDLLVTITSAGNAAATAFTADAPFNALQLIGLTDPQGDPIIVPIDGYSLYLDNKWHPMSDGEAPDTDPRLGPEFSVTSGAGASGGSAKFLLRVRLEERSRDAFAALANSDNEKRLRLTLSAAPLSSIYTTAPTAAPTIEVTATAHYWAEPPTSIAGVAVQPKPNGDGSVSYLSVTTPPVASGNQVVPLTDVGRVIKTIIFVLRGGAVANGTQPRVAADFPDPASLFINNIPVRFLPKTNWQREMAERYGYNRAALDAAGGLDTGVFVLSFAKLMGKASSWGTADQYLPTVSGTKLELRGAFGSAVSPLSLEVLTRSIAPISGASLYGY